MRENNLDTSTRTPFNVIESQPIAPPRAPIINIIIIIIIVNCKSVYTR